MFYTKQFISWMLGAACAAAPLGCTKPPSPSQLSQVDVAAQSNHATSRPQSASVTAATPQLPLGMVGTQSCAGCHPKQHASYLTTAHSRSLQRAEEVKMDLAGTLAHPLSETSYEVSELDHHAVHREWKYFKDHTFGAASKPITLSAADPRMVIAELPVRYVMGSGSFAKGYLLSDPPYLIQSPVTWYRGPKALGMAPGYDFKVHSGMTRVIADECLFCHAGSVTQRLGNNEQFDVPATAIGCERCHGPGLSHATKFKIGSDQSAFAKSNLENTEIVHPGKLSRSLAEAVCAQCHLQGDIVVQADGKSIWDFKPGEPLADTRIAYKIDSPKGDEKTFVDHFDQLWQSKCYLESDSLTCITCHDPHHVQNKDSAVADQQANCLKCHSDQACGLELVERQRQNENQCVACHMPKSASEVPHAATTNHLINIPAATVKIPQRPQHITLRKLYSPLDEAAKTTSRRVELLATAYWILDNVKHDDIPDSDVDKAIEDLIQLSQSQPKDASVLTCIARLARHQAEGSTNEVADAQTISDYWAIAGKYARAALAIELQPSANRKAALEVIASKQFGDGDFPAATQSYLELTRIRRAAIDWYNLGICYGRLKRFPEAEQALRESIRLNGTYAAPYRSLSILYSSVNPQLAEQMGQIHEFLANQNTALR